MYFVLVIKCDVEVIVKILIINFKSIVLIDKVIFKNLKFL